MKIACVYHSVDLDGWMSAAIVKHWWKTLYFDINNVHQTEEEDSLLLRGNFSNEEQERLTFIGYNYGQPIPDLSEYDKVIMCDISFPKDNMEILYNSKHFIWIDHHIDAIKENIPDQHIKNGRDKSRFIFEGIRDTKFAACELTWMYFFPDKPMPEIVRLLGRYDCWGYKGTSEEQKVLEFQFGVRAFITNIEDAYIRLTTCLINDYGNERILSLIHDSGKAIYGYLYTEAKQIYNRKFDLYFGKLKFAAINREFFDPTVYGIDYVADGYDGIASFYVKSDLIKFSLRTTKYDVDVLAISKIYGGGGHKSASGFILPLMREFRGSITIRDVALIANRIRDYFSHLPKDNL